MDIILQRRMLVLVLSIALAVVVAIVLPKATSAAPPDSSEHPNNGEPPDAVNPSLSTSNSCPFTVDIDISGKAKTVELPGGRTIVISPGAHATLTNPDEPANQVSYLITGAFHQTAAGDEVVDVVTTGRVLLFGPDLFGPGTSGIYLAIGRFTFQFNYEEGSYEGTQPTGTGRLIDVCERLE